MVDFHKRILFSHEAHFWLNGYVNKQNCRIWSEANPQVYVETPLHPEKLTVCSRPGRPPKRVSMVNMTTGVTTSGLVKKSRMESDYHGYENGHITGMGK
ncbi:hypothetical protein TNCV_437671 [Trichonephila clavipes]|nr:hypothetical protein TNCV_437671 [Trichonephila clavipes]